MSATRSQRKLLHTLIAIKLNGTRAIEARETARSTTDPAVVRAMISRLKTMPDLPPEQRSSKALLASRRRNGSTAGLTPEQVRNIRALRNAGQLLRIIAEQYGVSIPAVHDICSGKTYKHVD